MKLKSVNENKVNYPSGEKYYSFVNFFGSVAVGAAMVVSGCANKQDKSEKKNIIQDKKIEKKPVILLGEIAPVHPMKKPVMNPEKKEKTIMKGDLGYVPPMNNPVILSGNIKAPVKPKIIRKKGSVSTVLPKKFPDTPPKALGGLSNPREIIIPVTKKDPKQPVRRGRIRRPRPKKK